MTGKELLNVLQNMSEEELSKSIELVMADGTPEIENNVLLNRDNSNSVDEIFIGTLKDTDTGETYELGGDTLNIVTSNW